MRPGKGQLRRMARMGANSVHHMAKQAEKSEDFEAKSTHESIIELSYEGQPCARLTVRLELLGGETE